MIVESDSVSWSLFLTKSANQSRKKLPFLDGPLVPTSC